MSKFLIDVLDLVLKKYRTAMLNKEIDLSRLMMHVQQIKADKLRERDRVRGNKRARSEQYDYSQARSHGEKRPQFQSRPPIPAPSSASSAVPRGRQDQGNRPSMSRSQNSVSNRPRCPLCAKYAKDHPGEWLVGQRGFLVVASLATC